PARASPASAPVRRTTSRRHRWPAGSAARRGGSSRDGHPGDAKRIAIVEARLAVPPARRADTPRGPGVVARFAHEGSVTAPRRFDPALGGRAGREADVPGERERGRRLLVTPAPEVDRHAALVGGRVVDAGAVAAREPEARDRVPLEQGEDGRAPARADGPAQCAYEGPDHVR